MKTRFILLLALSLISARAEERFLVSQRNVNRPEMGVMSCLVVQAEMDEFTFFPPDSWRLEIDRGTRQLTLRSPTGDAVITLQFTKNNPATEPDAKADAWSLQVIERFRDSKLMEEFPCYTGLAPGKGCDVAWPGPNHQTMISRVGVAPYAHGAVEFTLTTTREQLVKNRHVYGALLTSFNHTPAPAAPATAKK